MQRHFFSPGLRPSRADAGIFSFWSCLLFSCSGHVWIQSPAQDKVKEWSFFEPPDSWIPGSLAWSFREAYTDCH